VFFLMMLYEKKRYLLVSVSVITSSVSIARIQ